MIRSIFAVVFLCYASVTWAVDLPGKSARLNAAALRLTIAQGGNSCVILDPNVASVSHINRERDNTFASWNRDGYIEWKVAPAARIDGDVFLDVSCGHGQGGQGAVVVDGTTAITFDVKPMSGWENYRVINIGHISLEAGAHVIRIHATTLVSQFLMNFRSGLITGKDLTSFMSDDLKVTKASWVETIVALRRADGSKGQGAFILGMIRELWADYPYQMSWLQQDLEGAEFRYLEAQTNSILQQKMISCVLDEAGTEGADLRTKLQTMEKNAAAPDQANWIALYEEACHARRITRMRGLLKHTSSIIYARHQVFGSKSGIYLITETEGMDGTSGLCKIDLSPEAEGRLATKSLLFDAKDGMVRDPELSFDGKRLLFAWRQTRNNISTTGGPAPTNGNYQIYEMELKSGAVRQLTTDETYGASFEPCYLPNGDIMFSSARIVQHITCGWGDCSNLFIMNKDGKYARRIGFDQTNTAFPHVTEDGRVLFTRRDYNDRGQSSAHALFQMNPDGTGQTEMYKNQSGTPNSIQHARGIPGSKKIVCILGGYHTTQGGYLAIMDVTKGREYAEGLIRLPGGDKPPSGDGPNDGYAKEGIQYSNPYAFNENEFLVSRADRNDADRCPYRIYYMLADGRRELLASDPSVSCLQPIPVMKTRRPAVRPTMVNYKSHDGVFYLQNAYVGAAVVGVKPGSIKKIRVAEILYKYDTISTGRGSGPGGAWDTVTASGHPIASFDAKRILGEATVYADGSAMFKVPSRKPLYFQLLDEQNHVIQTMRSWSTLMPGEKFSCVGCHEKKDTTPYARQSVTQAIKAGAEDLKPFYGPARGFSYMAEVQPVLDAYCIKCHKEGGDGGKKLILTAEPYIMDTDMRRKWARSYFELTKARPDCGEPADRFTMASTVWKREGALQPDEPNKYVTWWTRFELMHGYPPYRAGSIKSGMIQKLEKGHKDLKVSREGMDKLQAWIDMNIPYCGDYMEANLWDERTMKYHLSRVAERARNEAVEKRNIEAYIKDGQP